MSGIFISYRRRDSAGWAGRIYDRLVKRWGSHRVFLDVGALHPGDDFVDRIAETLASCDVVLAIIGQQFLVNAADGRPRLHEPGDQVRIELANALDRDCRVIPVLVDDASLPAADELPDELRSLLTLHAFDIRPNRFDRDVELLEEVLGGIMTTDGDPASTRSAAEAAPATLQPAPTLADAPGPVRRGHTRPAAVVGVVAAGAVAVFGAMIVVLRAQDGSDQGPAPSATELAAADRTPSDPQGARATTAPATPTSTTSAPATTASTTSRPPSADTTAVAAVTTTMSSASTSAPKSAAPGRCGVVVDDPAPPLNVRTGGATSFAVVSTLADGQEVSVQESRDGWSRLTAPAGWVNSTYLRESCEPAELDRECRTVVRDPDPPLRIRAGPDTDHQVVAEAADGGVLEVEENHGDWLEIRAPAAGFVSSAYTASRCS